MFNMIDIFVEIVYIFIVSIGLKYQKYFRVISCIYTKGENIQIILTRSAGVSLFYMIQFVTMECVLKPLNK